MAEKSASGSSLTIEIKAWFICRFICWDLTEENLEKVRVHVSNSSISCKGVKTKVKLSPNGWRVGYKPSHVRHFNQKLPYETLPLDCVEAVFQDPTYVNVLLCVFRLRNIPGMRFEITVYKFSDPNATRRIENIFQVLTGNSDDDTARFHPIPRRPYPLRTLPIYWNSAALSREDDVRRKTAATGSSSQSTDESVPSYGSSDVVSYREVAVTAYLHRSPTLSGNKVALQFHRYRAYLRDGVPMADVACQVSATGESKESTANGSPSSGDRDADGVMTATVRRIYNRTIVRRTPEPDDGLMVRTRPEHQLRWRSVEPLREDLRYLSVSRPDEQHRSQPPSQASSYLDGNFTKVYAPLRNHYSGCVPSSVYQYQSSGSRGYGERDLVSTRRY